MGSTLFGLNSDWWNGAVLLSLAIAALGTVAVAVASIGSVTVQKREAIAAKAELERYKSDAAVKIIDAEARALEAKAELAKYKSPRVLTLEQQERIGAMLKQFAGTPYDAAIGPMGDPEPLYLFRYIHNALVKAGWVSRDWPASELRFEDQEGLPAMGLTMVTNVIIDVHPDHWKELAPAAEALANALRANGIEAITGSKPTSKPWDAVHIRIGRKL